MHIFTDSQTFWEAGIHRGICLSPSFSGRFDPCLGKSSIVSSPFIFWRWTMLCRFCICRIIHFKETQSVVVDRLQLLSFYRTEIITAKKFSVSLLDLHLFLCVRIGLSFFILLGELFFTLLFSFSLPFLWCPFFSKPWNLHLFYSGVGRENILCCSVSFSNFLQVLETLS